MISIMLFSTPMLSSPSPDTTMLQAAGAAVGVVHRTTSRLFSKAHSPNFGAPPVLRLMESGMSLQHARICSRVVNQCKEAGVGHSCWWREHGACIPWPPPHRLATQKQCSRPNKLFRPRLWLHRQWAGNCQTMAGRVEASIDTT